MAVADGTGSIQRQNFTGLLQAFSLGIVTTLSFTRFLGHYAPLGLESEIDVRPQPGFKPEAPWGLAGEARPVA